MTPAAFYFMSACPKCNKEFFNPTGMGTHKNCLADYSVDAVWTVEAAGETKITNWVCPRHGRYPAFSSNPFTDEDVPYGCPSCGCKLEQG